MKIFPVNVPDGKRPEWVDGVLTLVDDTPQDITERIKTFEDAVNWCMENDFGSLCEDYDAAINSDMSKDVLAYLKLRIIVAALNEGWGPQFEYEEYRHYPDCVGSGYFMTGYSKGYYGNYPANLCFKSELLASYAAKQFKDIYMDFCKK